MATAPTTAIAARPADTIRAYLERCKPQLGQAVPETMRRVLTPDRVLRLVYAAMTRTPQLAACTPQSVALAVIGAVQLGLEPGGPLGHAYLVPFANRKSGKTECQLVTGYRGLLAIARRTGEIRSVAARVVRAADEWECSYGTDESIRHVPRWDGEEGDGSRVVAAYAVISLADGGRQIEVMTRGEIDAIRARSRAGQSGPWVTDYPEMARKTVLRRALKYAPQSVEMAAALAADADAHAEHAEAGASRVEPIVDVDLPADAPPSRTAAIKAALAARPGISVEREDGTAVEAEAVRDPGDEG